LWCYILICCYHIIKIAKIFAIQASQWPWAPILKPIHLSDCDTKFGHHTWHKRQQVWASRMCALSLSVAENQILCRESDHPLGTKICILSSCLELPHTS
jgi:hypothetical protein